MSSEASLQTLRAAPSGAAGAAISTADPRRATWPVLAVFVAPALLVYFGLTAYPAFRTMFDSFFTIEGSEATFVGLDNYKALLKDETFWVSVRNTFIWSFVAPILDVATGLLLALALYAGVPFARFLRVAWFTPVLLSYVVVAILWMWIYNYDWGILNITLRAVGLDALTRSWLGDPNTALAALIVTHAWKWAGFNMVVCLAAIHSLPSEVLGLRTGQLRLECEAPPYHHPDAAADPSQPVHSGFHRQDEDFRPRLDHDGGRTAMCNRDCVDLRLQARV